MPVPDPRKTLHDFRARYLEAVDETGVTGDDIDATLHVIPPVNLARRGLARGVTITISTGSTAGVVDALSRPGLVAAWRGFDTFVAEWVRPAGHADTSQLTTLVSRGRLPWFIDVEETRRYHVLVPNAVVLARGRVDWHAWEARASLLVSKPVLARSLAPWREEHDLPGIAVTGSLYPDQTWIWLAVLDADEPLREQLHALACSFPVATVIDSEGIVRSRHGEQRHVTVTIVNGLVPGKGRVECLAALSTILATNMSLPGDQFIVVPPVANVSISYPPGYPADPTLVFRVDGTGRWNVAPAMDKGRRLSFAEQWEAMQR